MLLSSIPQESAIKMVVVWLPSNFSGKLIDNRDSGYLGMAVQLYVQAHLEHYHILTQKEYSQI